MEKADCTLQDMINNHTEKRKNISEKILLKIAIQIVDTLANMQDK